MLITDQYRELNKQLHERPEYGISGYRYVGIVRQMIGAYKSTDILDYGCGKRTLQESLGFEIANYDPCIAGLDEAPEPHDLVVCTDVLEHIEPDCLDEVLKDIRRCTRKCCFLIIAIRPALKHLADGRNAHLIQEPFEWWKPRLENAGLKVMQHQPLAGEFAVTCI